MNRLFALLSGTILGTLLLSSCGISGGAEGETIKYPTVSEVENIDRRMGLEPRQVKPRMRSGSVDEVYEPAPAPGPQPAAPAPSLAPEPAPLQESTPPPQPAVDPETLQKLR